MKLFFPYIYMGDEEYFYVVTPLGSFRVNQDFKSFAVKLSVSLTIGIFAGVLMWRHLRGREKKKDKSENEVQSILEKSLKREPTNLETMVRERWNDADVVVKKDFGRLSSSLSIMRSKVYVHMSENMARSSGVKREKKNSKIEECRAVLRALYSVLLRKEQREVLDLNTSDAMIDTIKTSNPVLFGVLRAVNQSVIMPAVLHLNLEMLKTPMPVLDRPGADSWLVEVEASPSSSSSSSPSSIVVRHLRWARSSSDTKSNNYFEFRWILALNLDRNAKNLVSCTLTVVDFKPGENMADADIKRIGSLLGYGS